jgi:hypothetical protein
MQYLYQKSRAFVEFYLERAQNTKDPNDLIEAESVLSSIPEPNNEFMKREYKSFIEEMMEQISDTRTNIIGESR